MAVASEEIARSRDFLVRHGATRIILFGSAAERPDRARDLDIACEGIRPERFYAVAGELEWLLRRPVDLVDLSDDTPFTRHVESTGRVIYHA
jgi:predicted nucleotidyltransferase